MSMALHCDRTVQSRMGTGKRRSTLFYAHLHLIEIEKGNTMLVKTYAYLKVLHASRTLVIGLLVILSIAVKTGFIWIQTDQVIAPPGVRVLDWLWRAIVCRCPA